MVIQAQPHALTLVIESGGPARQRSAAQTPQADRSFESWVDPHGRHYGCCFHDGSEYHVHLHGVGSFAFTEHAAVVRGIPAADVLPDAFRTAFYREVVPLVLQHQSWEVLHASGLVVGDGCVALCGSSQAGKSTLAHAWRLRGGGIFADDVIPFRMQGGTVRIGAVPFRVRLRPPSLRHFGVPPPEEGQEFIDRDLSIDGRAELRSIYLLDHRRDEEEGAVTLEPVSPAAALPALLGQAYCLTLRARDRTRVMMERYISLAGSVPIFRLSYPTGLGHVNPTLDCLASHATIPGGPL